jgi:hypothetical protein
MVALGSVCIAVAAIWILFRWYLAYNSAGGTVVVTVYDAAIYPPPLLALGLYFLLPTFGINWAIWVFVVICLATGGLVAAGIRIAEEVGDRPL